MNGLLFPGGNAEFQAKGGYAEAVKVLYDEAVKVRAYLLRADLSIQEIFCKLLDFLGEYGKKNNKRWIQKEKLKLSAVR